MVGESLPRSLKNLRHLDFSSPLQWSIWRRFFRLLCRDDHPSLTDAWAYLIRNVLQFELDTTYALCLWHFNGSGELSNSINSLKSLFLLMKDSKRSQLSLCTSYSDVPNASECPILHNEKRVWTFRLSSLHSAPHASSEYREKPCNAETARSFECSIVVSSFYDNDNDDNNNNNKNSSLSPRRKLSSLFRTLQSLLRSSLITSP